LTNAAIGRWRKFRLPHQMVPSVKTSMMLISQKARVAASSMGRNAAALSRPTERNSPFGAVANGEKARMRVTPSRAGNSVIPGPGLASSGR